MKERDSQGPVTWAVVGLTQLAAVMVLFALVDDLVVRYMPDLYPLLFGGAVALGLIFRMLLIRFRGWRQNDRLFGVGLVMVSVLFVAPTSLMSLVLFNSSLETLVAANGLMGVATTLTAFMTTLLYGIEPDKQSH